MEAGEVIVSRTCEFPDQGKELSLTAEWENPLEEEMAIHSSMLAWRIPRREEPGGL